MPKQDYWPASWAALVAFFQNLHAQLTTHQATLGITAGQLLEVAADRDLVIAMNDACNNSDAYAKECTAFREAVVNSTIGTGMPAAPTLPPAVVIALGALAATQARTRRLVNQVKAHNAYTQAIGQSLGIIGAEAAPQNVGIDSATPLTGSIVELNLFLAGFGTVAVRARRGGGAFEQIGISTQEIFTDSRAPLVAGQPETREYQVQAHQNNQLVGPSSPIVAVVTLP
jgi:hypothetical protein